MPPTIRVKGHALVSEGAPHDDNGQRILRGYWQGVSGAGRAKCSCGLLSDDMPSATQRRRWHRAHKLTLLAEATP